jgi:peptide subunit release factor 1 (eRF1)
MNARGTLETVVLDTIGTTERGYDFITQEHVQSLKALQLDEPGVFSLYMDISPQRIQHEPVPARYRHLVEEIANNLEDNEQRKKFQVVADDIGTMLLNEYNLLRGQGLVIFAVPERVSAKGSREVTYSTLIRYHTPEPVADLLTWDTKPTLAPLLIQLDLHKPAGVILVDRQRARYFLFNMGEVAEYTVSEWDPTPQKTRALGWGAHDHEQWLEEKYREHLRHAVSLAEALGQRDRWQWLIIGGTGQTPQDLANLLSKPFQEKLLGTLPMDVDAGYDQVRDAVVPLIRQAEMANEQAILATWLSELESQGKATAGPQATVQALHQARVDTLLTLPNLEQKGWQCLDCAGLVADVMQDPPVGCPYCGGELKPLPDIMLPAITQTLEHGGHVVFAQHEEDQRLLEQHGNIGALLRF